MAHPYHKEAKAAEAVRAKRHADGGFVSEIQGDLSPEDDRKFKADVMRRQISTGARQVFDDGTRGPMNINPTPMKPKRTRGGKVR